MSCNEKQISTIKRTKYVRESWRKWKTHPYLSITNFNITWTSSLKCLHIHYSTSISTKSRTTQCITQKSLKQMEICNTFIVWTSTLRHMLCLLRTFPISNTDHYFRHGQLVHPHSHCHSHIHILFCVSWLDLRTKTLLWVEIKDKSNHKKYILCTLF